ncbi:DNA-directed RNA polymerase [Mesorhizobium sp. M7A.F.Ca.CA.004.02.1.1]|uniref:DNA-directed RNA polymerase n=1 Tax=Mesorhizobium sp. M7A.F.Ca.CA.004.02.1.1 TaxID=2496690 RepID=UPI000FCC9CED|nr:DNA-directed RNA polymerase [Mesorhizobium sp. M7A.F.Ca.CA.004.02.1.1]RVB02836.1 T3/T7 RNA polymerase [Mesorhizobium sp. M7A.F.Ca.CA.004.02.1.1]
MNAHCSTLHSPAYLRQAKLEVEMTGLGTARYHSYIKKEVEAERGSDIKSGGHLMQQVIGPMSAAISAFVADVYAGRPGPKAVAAKLIRNMDPQVVAYLAARAILSRLMHRSSATLIGVSRLVAIAVEGEARFEEFAKLNPKLFAKIARHLSDDGATEQHKRTVLTYSMGKYDIPWDRWSKPEMILLGSKLTEIFCEHTGLATIELTQATFTGPYREQYMVSMTPKVTEWIGKSIMKGELLQPYYMPTVIPPKDWDSLSGGGYHTEAVRPLQLVRRAKPAQIKLLKEAHLGAVYGGLNAIQRTGWAINDKVLDVMKQFIAAGSDLAGLIPKRDIDMPVRPEGIDTDPTILREWKWQARDVYKANLQRAQDRLAQEQLVELAQKFSGDPLFFPHNLDFRGRAYPVPLGLNPQGPDNVKALIMFDEALPLEDDGERWLAIHGANVFGVDKVKFDDRVKWVEENRFLIWAQAIDPFANLWWTEADKPWCFLAFCFEWLALDQEGDAFKSHLPIALDGSCNGLQHFSAMLLDSVGGAAVNLIPADEPQDIYAVVAMEATAALRRIASATGDLPVEETPDPDDKKKRGPTEAERRRWAHEWLHFGLDRDLTKRPVMVLPYGGTPRSCVKYVELEVKKRIADGQEHNLGDDLSRAIGFLAGIIWSSIGDVVIAAKEAMAWLQAVARIIAKKNLPVHWTTPSGFVGYQSYMDTRHRMIKTKISGSTMRLLDHEETDDINRAKQATSISPNFVHSLDASAMILTVALLAAMGIRSFAMIHDSYGTHACNTTLLATKLREVFVRMYETSPLTHFRDELVENLGPSLLDELPELPQTGDLNLWQIMNSEFFFA